MKIVGIWFKVEDANGKSYMVPATLEDLHKLERLAENLEAAQR